MEKEEYINKKILEIVEGYIGNENAELDLFNLEDILLRYCNENYFKFDVSEFIDNN